MPNGERVYWLLTNWNCMKKGHYIDHGQNSAYNKAKLIEAVKTKNGLEIEIWHIDFQHALEGHPEVTLERIRVTLKNPMKVIQSKRSNRVCLFYKLEIAVHPDFGKIYFCVVVGVLGEGKGKLETAYETTVIKLGTTLYDKERVK
jgi:hypothetical protein